MHTESEDMRGAPGAPKMHPECHPETGHAGVYGIQMTCVAPPWRGQNAPRALERGVYRFRMTCVAPLARQKPGRRSSGFRTRRRVPFQDDLFAAKAPDFSFGWLLLMLLVAAHCCYLARLLLAEAEIQSFGNIESHTDICFCQHYFMQRGE